MRAKGSNIQRDSEVARILNDRINSSDRSQADIADRLGYARPNMITMIKQGLSRLPFDKLSAMASLINMDSRDLLEAALEEYEPHIWGLFKEHYMRKPARDVAAVIEAVTAGKKDAGKDLVVLSKDDLKAIQKIVSDAGKR